MFPVVPGPPSMTTIPLAKRSFFCHLKENSVMHEAIRLGTGRETREIEFGSAGSEVERPNGSGGLRGQKKLSADIRQDGQRSYNIHKIRFNSRRVSRRFSWT